MPVNPVLQFAIDHHHRTLGLLRGVYGIPQDEVDDCGQLVLLRILRADPREVIYPKAYWSRTLRTVAMDWWQDRHRAPVHYDFEDGPWLEDCRQDPMSIVEVAEQIVAAIDAATPSERAALRTALSASRPLVPGERVHLCRLRRKLRAGAVA